MPTNVEIFAGSNKDFNNDNIIQVAKEHRNKDLVRLFNANRPTDRIHVSTVGARICRSLQALADIAGISRAEFKSDFEATRVRNGVAGKNQHTGAAAPQPSSQQPKAAKKTSAASISRPMAQRRDSAVGGLPTPSPPRRQSARVAAGAPLPAPAAGKERDRAAVDGAGDAESQQDDRPTKAAKTSSPPRRSSSGAEGASGAADGRKDSSQRRKSAAAGNPGSSDSDSDSDWERGFCRGLDDAELSALLGKNEAIDDDLVLEFARRMTIPEMVRAANRAAGERFWTAVEVRRRVAAAVERLGERRGRRMSVQMAVLDEERGENGIEVGGMGRRR